MTNTIRRLAVAAVFTVGMAAWADDPPKPPAEAPKDAPKPPAGFGVLNTTGPQLHSAGQLVAKLSKAGDSSVTVKIPAPERTGSSGRRGTAGTRMVEKDHEYDLTSEAKVRWHDLPKKPDGKTYTDQEYQTLREPVGTPGYKADKSDLKPGQTVRLYLSKAGKDDKPVVTVVVIVADAPKQTEKPADKKK